GAFSIVNVSQTGFSDILVGSMLLVFDGERYVEEAEPEPTDLDTAAFEAACMASPHVAAVLAEESVPGRAVEFCACTGGLFGQMGMDQQDLDEAARAYADPAVAIDGDIA